MAYTPTNWTDNATQANAARLNKLEQGVKEAHDLAEAGGGGATAAPHPSFPWALILTTSGGEDPDNFAPTVTITSATALDLTATVTWTASDPEDDPLTFSIDWGDGSTSNLVTSPAQHTYDAEDAGTVTITVTASDGSKTGSDTAEVIIVDPDGPSPYRQAVIADEPLMYWPLDEATAPAMEVISATATTSASWPLFGALGIGDGDTCVDFYNGGAVPAAAIIDAGPAAATNGLTTYTIECIIEPASNSGSGYLVERDDATSNRVFRLSRNTQKFQFAHRGGPTVTTTNDYPAGFIYHVAAVADGTNLTLYINGTVDGTAASTTALVTKTVNLSLGGALTTTAFRFLGKMAGVAIYNRALSQAEIQEHVAAANIPA